MSWIYEDTKFEFNDGSYYGFVYTITNTITNKIYIGRKFLTKAGYKTVKGKRKKIRVESDWLDYYGSSPLLHADILALGKDSFVRTIVTLCKTRGECNYEEAKLIFLTGAILTDTYYNESIMCRIHKNHVKNLLVVEGNI